MEAHQFNLRLPPKCSPLGGMAGPTEQGATDHLAGGCRKKRLRDRNPRRLQFWALASSILGFRFEPKNIPTHDKTRSNLDPEA